MKIKISLLALSFLVVGPFAFADNTSNINFDDMVKNQNLTPVKVSTGQCHIDVLDKLNGVDLSSDEFTPVANRHTGNQYLSLWKFHLGSDDSNLFVSVEPFVDANAKLALHILIADDHGNNVDQGKAGSEATVELIGSENNQGQILFHSWANDKFDFRDGGKYSQVVGVHKNGAFKIQSSTDELDYKVNCKF